MPENIRYGVTITPPDGEPVTGTALPKTTNNVYCLGGGLVASSPTIIGARPAGITVDVNGREYTTINGTGKIVSGYVFYTLTGSLKITGDYKKQWAQTGRCTVGYIPPTTLSDTGITIQNGYNSTFLVLFDNCEEGLVASNIVSGVTINGITGTMDSGTVSEYFAFNFRATGTASYTRSTSSQTFSDKNSVTVTNIPSNNGMIFFALNNSTSKFYATINGTRQTISTATQISSAVNTLTIAETNWDARSVGCPAIFFN